MNAPRTHIPIGEHDEGRRLDRVLRHLLSDVPLSRVYSLLRKGAVRVNGRSRKASYRLRHEDVIELPPDLAGAPTAAAGADKDTAEPDRPEQRGHGAEASRARLPAELTNRVLYENEHLLAIDKPAGLPVHGHKGLLAQLLPYLRSGADKSISFRPGPLHRLDRNTGGLMLFPKSLAGSQRVSDLLRRGKLAKGYIALLEGRLEKTEWWEDRLVRDRSRGVTRVLDEPDGGGSGSHGGGPGRGGGPNRGGNEAGTSRSGSRAGEHAQAAVSAVRPLAWPVGNAYARTLALVYLGTGRTHQIRAQAAAHGHPLAGDRKYGGGANKLGYYLHAAVMLNTEPDEVFPEPHICAVEQTGFAQRLARYCEAENLEVLDNCTSLAEMLSDLMYKDFLAQ